MLQYLLALTIICSPATDRVVETVTAYIQTTYPIENADYQFDFRRVNWGVIPAEFDSVRVLSIGKDSPVGNTIFIIGIYQDSGLAKTIPIPVGVTLLADVLVAKTPINIGFPITGLTSERRTINNQGEIPVVDSTLFIGKQAKNYIPAGSIVYMSMAEAKPAICPGDRVIIVVEDSAIKITANGVARQRGCAGDIIKVANQDSKKIIEAEIIDSVTVVVK